MLRDRQQYASSTGKLLLMIRLIVSSVIATSGPSSTYPQRAYRNPTDALVKFLDQKHGTHWAIWEFRAEGTGYPDSEVHGRIRHYPWPDHHPPPFGLMPNIMASMRNWLKDPGAKENARVVVVHCKAGKGRSGTVACSYLISEENWTIGDALDRFTSRRMRVGFGAGISIPSQIRWVGYVDRWARNGKFYTERQVEILEVHVWGLRDGVKVAIEGFVDEGKTIKTFHVFRKDERMVIGDTAQNSEVFANLAGLDKKESAPTSESAVQVDRSAATERRSDLDALPKTLDREHTGYELGGGAVIFRPSTRVVLPTNDIKIDFERRNKATYGWTMVTSVAHVWFNAFFEGQGPESGGNAAPDGVFQIEWDAMDGIKGSSQKGTRAFDRLSVLWKALDGRKEGLTQIITEPGIGDPVPQMKPAEWHKVNSQSPTNSKDLGLRVQSPDSESMSRASSTRSDQSMEKTADEDSVAGIRTHGPDGEEHISHGGRDVAYNGPVSKRDDNAGQASGIERVGLGTVVGIMGQMKPLRTGDLPGGKPEEEMETSTDSSVGSVTREKNTSPSS